MNNPSVYDPDRTVVHLPNDKWYEYVERGAYDALAKECEELKAKALCVCHEINARHCPVHQGDCVTHHICDCLQAKLDELQKENEELKIKAKELEDFLEFKTSENTWLKEKIRRIDSITWERYKSSVLNKVKPEGEL